MLHFNLPPGIFGHPHLLLSQDTHIVPEALPALTAQRRLVQIRSPHTGLSSEM